jgi:hypothetical protein
MKGKEKRFLRLFFSFTLSLSVFTHPMSQTSGPVANKFLQKIASKEFRGYFMRYA